MPWLELIVVAIYLQAFVWYGRLSYVQGVLDRHHEPDASRVRRVLRGFPTPIAAMHRARLGRDLTH